MENITKSIDTKKLVGPEESQPLNASVVVNARNVRFLDKILSKKCKKCNSLKPPHSHHCSICKRCVAKMDHHCPWVNNCVGVNNHYAFMSFLFLICSTLLFMLISIACNFKFDVFIEASGPMSFLYFFTLESYSQAMYLAGASIVLAICAFFILPVA